MQKNLWYVAIAGNFFYILWILYNGVEEGGRPTPVHITAYIGIILLLALNIILLYRKK